MHSQLYKITIAAFILIIAAMDVNAQDLGESLSMVDGRPGKKVIVNLTLEDNTNAAQAGINILFNPNIADIENLNIDVSPGPALQDSGFFIIPGVKDRSLQDGINIKGLFIGIFADTFPPPAIPNGDIATIIFTISDDAKPTDFTDLRFSFISFNPTSFASQNGIPISIDNSNFTDGLITVVRSGDDGGSSCALAYTKVSHRSVVDLASIFLIPIAFVIVRRLLKKS